MEHCSQCGESTPRLHEGYCEECSNERQRALDEHNAWWDRWQSMTDYERNAAMKDAIRRMIKD